VWKRKRKDKRSLKNGSRPVKGELHFMLNMKRDMALSLPKNTHTVKSG
jgi:hypothetical protein